MSANKITVLQTVGPALTKTFYGDGRIDSYDDAASFKIKEVDVSSIRELSALLAKIHSQPTRCIIRGTPRPEDQRPLPGNAEGTWRRKLENFSDEPKHFFLADIDGHRPDFGDPVLEPEACIQDFIQAHLPACFHGASFHWQLSSSAGTEKAKGVLKAHVWFWLEKPYTSAQLSVWAKKVVGPAIDAAVFRTVQVHYTGDPLFLEGARDPVPRRYAFHQGAHDPVALDIDPDLLAKVHEATAADGAGNDHKLVDPSEKEGLIGLFHRTFDAEHVLSEFLGDEFEQVTERRWTWVNGGGTPEGVWIHSDGMHVGSNHNTWPIDGISNLWDLVRVFKFGHLDACDSSDDFEKLDAESGPIQSKPSQLAMLDWASQLPEIKESVKQEREGKVDACITLIKAAADAHGLEFDVAPALQEETELSLTDRERLAALFQARMKEVAGVKLPIAQVRRLIAPSRARITAEGAPDWAKRWVWVRELDEFMNVETKMTISMLSYNASYDRFMGRYADENGNVPRAAEFALTTWETLVVDQAVYLPNFDEFFWLDGRYCINLYRDNLAPAMPEKFSAKDLEAVAVLEAHAELMVPDARERRLMLDWIAYCIQKPGAKIRWAVLLKGIPGDGKTAFATLLAHCMGHPNVRTLSSNTLEGSDFTGWSAGQCVVTLEEVKIQGANRYDVFNKLKPYITNDTCEWHPKGRDPRTVPNTSNYFLLTNHNDALPLDDNDRRIMPIWSPFVTKEQLFAAIKERFNMDHGDYFDRLFDRAIKAHAGALRKWFMERELSPEFKADGRAPETSVRELMVDISRADDEMAAAEILEAGGIGIYPGLVSATHLTEEIRRRFDGLEVRTRRVQTLLSNMGYSPFRQMKWKNRNCRVYLKHPYHVQMPAEEIRDALDRHEKLRESNEIEADFAD